MGGMVVPCLQKRIEEAEEEGEEEMKESEEHLTRLPLPE